MTSKKTEKNRKIFECETCEYVTRDKRDYNRHLTTGKHKRLTNASKMLPENPNNDIDCVCGKSYKHRQSFFKHKKTCTFIEEKEENAITQNTQNSGEATRQWSTTIN